MSKSIVLSETATDPKYKLRPKEKATACFYQVVTGKWLEEKVKIQWTVSPFAEGGIRAAYHALVYFEKNTQHPSKQNVYQCVVKIAKQKQKDEIYYLDVAMQMYARWWSEKYNEKKPPKTVTFVHAFVVKIEKTKELFGVEDWIEGQYMKHSDNNGWVASNSESQTPMRNTPHAFSHFTYEASGHRFVVVDIQGVGDYYTDPQIHTADRKGFGLGNLGQDGINRFLETHQCNPLCHYLNLPPVGKSLAPKVNSLSVSGERPLAKSSEDNIGLSQPPPYQQAVSQPVVPFSPPAYPSYNYYSQSPVSSPIQTAPIQQVPVHNMAPIQNIPIQQVPVQNMAPIQTAPIQQVPNSGYYPGQPYYAPQYPGYSQPYYPQQGYAQPPPYQQPQQK